jgi:hypothetical protein
VNADVTLFLVKRTGKVAKLASQQPKVGEVVTLAYKRHINAPFLFASGTVKAVEGRNDFGKGIQNYRFFYDISTDYGDCRAAVFTRDGRILGGHRYAKVSSIGGLFPGGDLDFFHVSGQGTRTITTAGLARWEPFAGRIGLQGPGTGVQWVDHGFAQRMPHKADVFGFAGSDEDHVWKRNPHVSDSFVHSIGLSHIYLKCGNNRVRDELGRFQHITVCDEFLKAFRRKMQGMILRETKHAVAFVDPFTPLGANQMVEALAGIKVSSSAGYPYGQMTVGEAIEAEGGLLILAKQYLDFLQRIVNDDITLVEMKEFWTVFGKRDKYLTKKILEGKDVQFKGLLCECVHCGTIATMILMI